MRTSGSRSPRCCSVGSTSSQPRQNSRWSARRARMRSHLQPHGRVVAAFADRTVAATRRGGRERVRAAARRDPPLPCRGRMRRAAGAATPRAPLRRGRWRRKPGRPAAPPTTAGDRASRGRAAGRARAGGRRAPATACRAARAPSRSSGPWPARSSKARIASSVLPRAAQFVARVAAQHRIVAQGRRWCCVQREGCRRRAVPRRATFETACASRSRSRDGVRAGGAAAGANRRAGLACAARLRAAPALDRRRATPGRQRRPRGLRRAASSRSVRRAGAAASGRAAATARVLAGGPRCVLRAPGQCEGRGAGVVRVRPVRVVAHEAGRHRQRFVDAAEFAKPPHPRCEGPRVARVEVARARRRRQRALRIAEPPVGVGEHAVQDRMARRDGEAAFERGDRLRQTAFFVERVAELDEGLGAGRIDAQQGFEGGAFVAAAVGGAQALWRPAGGGRCATVRARRGPRRSAGRRPGRRRAATCSAWSAPRRRRGSWRPALQELVELAGGQHRDRRARPSRSSPAVACGRCSSTCSVWRSVAAAGPRGRGELSGGAAATGSPAAVRVQCARRCAASRSPRARDQSARSAHGAERGLLMRSWSSSGPASSSRPRAIRWRASRPRSQCWSGVFGDQPVQHGGRRARGRRRAGRTRRRRPATPDGRDGRRPTGRRMREARRRSRFAEQVLEQGRLGPRGPATRRQPHRARRGRGRSRGRRARARASARRGRPARSATRRRAAPRLRRSGGGAAAAGRAGCAVRAVVGGERLAQHVDRFVEAGARSRVLPPGCRPGAADRPSASLARRRRNASPSSRRPMPRSAEVAARRPLVGRRQHRRDAVLRGGFVAAIVVQVQLAKRVQVRRRGRAGAALHLRQRGGATAGIVRPLLGEQAAQNGDGLAGATRSRNARASCHRSWSSISPAKRYCQYGSSGARSCACRNNSNMRLRSPRSCARPTSMSKCKAPLVRASSSAKRSSVPARRRASRSSRRSSQAIVSASAGNAGGAPAPAAVGSSSAAVAAALQRARSQLASTSLRDGCRDRAARRCRARGRRRSALAVAVGLEARRDRERQAAVEQSAGDVGVPGEEADRQAAAACPPQFVVRGGAVPGDLRGDLALRATARPNASSDAMVAGEQVRWSWRTNGTSSTTRLRRSPALARGARGRSAWRARARPPARATASAWASSPRSRCSRNKGEVQEGAQPAFVPRLREQVLPDRARGVEVAAFVALVRLHVVEQRALQPRAHRGR